MHNTLAVVLSGGGARGAYQAGVLKRIGEIKHIQDAGNPFPIVEGCSAGAINAAALAVGSSDFGATTGILARLWSELKPADVFRCDVLSQAQNSFTWLVDLSFGGMVGGGHARSLLDAAPLRAFLDKHIPCRLIQSGIKQGHLRALIISATRYTTGKTYLFIQGQSGHPTWEGTRRIGISTNITVDHICASAAIPLVFRPVKLPLHRGHAYFGDGCMRMQRPLSPVIRMGAGRILAVGACRETAETAEAAPREPSVAQVVGALVNVMFLDHLTTDVEQAERFNQLLEACPREKEHLRPVSTLLINPSVDFSELAHQHRQDMPYLIQYFVSGLGQEAAACADLMSYLMFTPRYTKALIDIGYRDANKRIDEIEDFLSSSSAAGNGSARPSRRRAG